MSFNFKRDAIIPSVKRGAELLDEVLPGWNKAINQRLLNLATAFPSNKRILVIIMMD